jgi:hypothetical protein
MITTPKKYVERYVSFTAMGEGDYVVTLHLTKPDYCESWLVKFPAPEELVSGPLVPTEIKRVPNVQNV